MSLAAFLASKYGQYTIAALLLISLALGIRAHLINQGKQEGKAETTQVVATDEAKHVATSYDATATTIAALQSKIDELEKRQQTLTDSTLKLAAQRQAIAGQVSGLNADQVAAAVAAALGRQSGDTKPLTVDEQRKVLACFEERSACDKQLAAAQQQTQNAQQQADTEQKKYDALAPFTNQLYGSYVELYNLTAQPKRAPKCLWLFRCKKPQIQAPDPKKLVPPEVK